MRWATSTYRRLQKCRMNHGWKTNTICAEGFSPQVAVKSQGRQLARVSKSEARRGAWRAFATGEWLAARGILGVASEIGRACGPGFSLVCSEVCFAVER